MIYFITIAIIAMGFSWNMAIAQHGGEASEPTPEELDAAFTSEDAAREAVLFSDQIPDRAAADPLGDMISEADLVFRGTVAAQSYVYDSNDGAFTHTTFTIAEVLEGDYASDTITLVQLGGPSKTDDTVSMFSTSHYFNVGEEELLFLALDPEQPAAQNRTTIQFRFPVFEGQVYTGDGYGLIVEPVDDGARHNVGQSSSRNPDARFRQINIGSRTFTKHFSSEENVSGSANTDENARQAAPAGNDFLESVDVSTFSAAIKR